MLARLLTRQDILHFFLQLVSQDSAQELLKRTISPYLGVSRIEFQFCCLWIRFVSQGVVCFHSVDFGGHVQDIQYVPRIFVDNLRKDNQVLGRLHTKEVISHFFLQLVSQDSAQELFRRTIAPYFGVLRIEFQLCCLWIRFVSQGVVCFHSVDFGDHTLDSQYAPRFFVDNLRNDRQVLARLHTKQVISHFFLQLVSQDSAQELFRLTIAPYLGVSRIEFQFCCLWTRFVSQGVVSLNSVVFGGSWTFTVIYLNVSRGSTLFVLFIPLT